MLDSSVKITKQLQRLANAICTTGFDLLYVYIACPKKETMLFQQSRDTKHHVTIYFFEWQIQTKLAQLNEGSFFLWSLVFQIACVSVGGIDIVSLVLFQE